MPSALAFNNQVFQAGISRLDAQGLPLCELKGCVIRLIAATPPSALTPHTSKLEGVDVASFLLGDAPKLHLDVPIRCVNDYLKLLRGQAGMRKDDLGPLSAETFERYKEQNFLKTDVASALLVRPHALLQGRALALHLDWVELTVEDCRQTDGIVTSVSVNALVHQNLLREYTPIVGQAGCVFQDDRWL